MKLLTIISIGLMAVAFSSCSSTPTSRINKHPELYTPLSQKHKNLVAQGKIDRGMTQPAVYLATGHPDAKYTDQRNGKSFEIWNYNVYTPIYHHGFYPHIGYGSGWWGGYGFYGGYYTPSLTYLPQVGSTIAFTNGKVSSWRISHRGF